MDTLKVTAACSITFFPDALVLSKLSPSRIVSSGCISCAEDILPCAANLLLLTNVPDDEPISWMKNCL